MKVSRLNIKVAEFEIVSAEDRPITREEAIKRILAYYKENEEDFNSDIEELDSWNGYLSDDRYYDMWDLDELLSGKRPSEVLELARGNNFNTYDDYFRFTFWGIESANNKDYSDYLYETTIEDIINNACNLYLCGEVEEIINKIEE